MTPQHFIPSAGVTLAAYTWGNPQTAKATLVLVHGYPDSAKIWQEMAQLLAQNYYVISYDVRGAGESSIPKSVSQYDLSYLRQDLQAVIDTLAPNTKVHLVAHDWGSIQTWEAVTEPSLQDRIASYITISGPCLDHVGHWIRQRLGQPNAKSVTQLAKQFSHSWYIWLFHMPFLAPNIWRFGGERLWPMVLNNIEGITEEHPNPSQVKDGRYGINLYRANIFKYVLSPRKRHTTVPVQLVVPSGDHFMIPDIFDDLAQWVPQLTRTTIDAGHWVPLSHAPQLTQIVRQFIQKQLSLG